MRIVTRQIFGTSLEIKPPVRPSRSRKILSRESCEQRRKVGVLSAPSPSPLDTPFVKTVGRRAYGRSSLLAPYRRRARKRIHRPGKSSRPAVVRSAQRGRTEVRHDAVDGPTLYSRSCAHVP